MKRFKKYKLLLFEICETLGTICFMLAERGQDTIARKYRFILRNHGMSLRKKSEFLIGVQNESDICKHKNNEFKGEF